MLNNIEFEIYLNNILLVKQVEIEGLTGDIRFTEEGKRVNYTLHVVEMTVNSAMVKVAEWSDVSGMNPVLAKFTRIKSPKQEFEKNKTYILTTLLEEPFMMLKTQENNEILQGNDQFEGYCKDLADLIAKKLDINCMFAVFQTTLQSKPEKKSINNCNPLNFR